MLAAQLVLNLLQALAFRLRQYEEREQHAQYAKHGEQPVQQVLAEHLLQITGEFGDEEGDQPAHGHRDPGSFRLHVRREHFAHHGPRERSPAYAVQRDEDNQRDDRKPRYAANVRFFHVLEEHVEAQRNLKIKERQNVNGRCFVIRIRQRYDDLVFLKCEITL